MGWILLIVGLVAGIVAIDVLRSAKKWEAKFAPYPDIYVMAGYYTAATFAGATSLAFVSLGLVFLTLGVGNG